MEPTNTTSNVTDRKLKEVPYKNSRANSRLICSDLIDSKRQDLRINVEISYVILEVLWAKLQDS